LTLSTVDVAVFGAYFIGVVAFALIVAARSTTRATSSDFFLASKKLPWYAVGASFIASNISTEHFIGMVGWGFLYGMAVAQWEWGNVVTFTLLIWVFLPFYMRGNVATMPEFLERRFNPACRYIYAVAMIVGLVIAMLGGVLFAGAKAINVFFPNVPMTAAILILAIAAGTYTVYGGLLSAVWADFLQYCLLMTGGIIVTIYGLYHVGGLGTLMEEMPEKFLVFYPPTHEMIPFTGIVFGLFSVGVWYSCANQFMVQRCLGARSEWDARMGVIMAGFSKAVLPFIVVLPGIMAFYLYQDRISDGDQAWPFLVRLWLPAGLVGLVLAGLASAIMSTLSAITNSSATIFTLDLYQKLLRPTASDRELHNVGRLSAAVAMLVGIVVALVLAQYPGLTVFALIQQVFFYVAPPIAAIFLIGIMWRGATPVAATLTLLVGFGVFLPLAKFVLFRYIDLLKPFDNFMHHTFTTFVLSAVFLVVVSWFTRPKPREQLEGVVWTKSALGLRHGERALNRGLRNLALWWALMAAAIVGLYTYTHMQGSSTQWLEAENVPHTVSGAGKAILQERRELAETEKFNLWTGKGQVRFEAAGPSASLVFEIPIHEAGAYKLAALVTQGPEYGRFSVSVNGEPAEISYLKAAIDASQERTTVERVSGGTFDARFQPSAASANPEFSLAEKHVVRRIDLGMYDLEPGDVQVAFIAEDGETPACIGVDQLMATDLGKQ
jgi:solute:Na+ symporter, SSS family